MRKVRTALLIASTLVLFACSKSGKGGAGTPDDYEGIGAGNIPIAEPGKELKDINFDYDSTDISSSGQSILKENARWMLDNPSKKVTVEGHCDERGTADYNMALGLRRAEAVKSFLRTTGVQTRQMNTVSYGEELPLVSGSTESAWSQNRRAHFAIE